MCYLVEVIYMNSLIKCFQKKDTIHQNTSMKRIENIRLEIEKLQPDDSKYLYVILPYFNYCNSNRRRELFIEFVNRYNNETNVRICIIEARLKNTEYDLPHSFHNIYKHIGVTVNDYIWIKEALINTMIEHLPNTWKYMAWIDADITFLNTNWVNETLKALHIYDVIQLYQTCINMGPNNEAMKIDKSFGYMHIESGTEWVKTYKYGLWHPGYAWACNRFAYQSFGGLIDFGVLGSGDHHMALALIGKVDSSHPVNIHENYKNLLLKFQDKCTKNNIKLGYVKGSLIHHWHGRLQDRKYVERWKFLTENKYDPTNDITYNKTKMIEFTDNGKRFNELFKTYFVERNEDNIEL
jgi:hypothetical protein